ncbi:MAG: hypothetical protein ABIT09_00855 [Croceibacterium sp.]
MTLRTLMAMPPARPVLVWALIAVGLVAMNLGNIATRHFPDPDDTLRLVQVRDLLGGQGWFDLHQYRINPPYGTLMHWSRLVDLPLALMIAALTPLLGAANAEITTMVTMPLLTMLAIVLVVDRLAGRLFDRQATVFACLCLGLAPLLMAQVQPLRIDHHGWQIFTVMAALLGLLPGAGVKGAAWSAAALAFGLSISLELLPVTAAFGGVFALRWLTAPRSPHDLMSYLATLTGTLAALFLATRGLADLAAHCDSVSPPYLVMLAGVTAGTCGAAALRPRSWLAVLALLALSGAAALAVFLWLAPACSAGPFAALDPLVREYWYNNIQEGRPAWNSPLVLAGPAIAQGVIGLAVVVHLWLRSSGEERRWWLSYLLVTVAAFATGLMLWRGMAFVGALAALPLGWLAARMMAGVGNARSTGCKLAIVSALLMVLVPSLPGALIQDFTPARAAEAQVPSNPASEACGLPASADRLGALAPATIFAPMDVGPALLVETHHAVVASSHHRAAAAMHDVIAAFTGSTDLAHRLIIKHRAGYVMVCTDLTEARLYANRAPGGFADQLIKGRVPPWLEPVALGGPAEFKLWKMHG